MKLILASDSFKGSLTSKQANAILERAAKSVFEDCKCKQVQIADGGEGTLEAIMGDENEQRYERMYLSVTNPLGEKIPAYYLKKGNKAMIEMAIASGLTLVEPEKRNPLYTTSRGTGELIYHALKQGCTDICIGIGGSATNDGGMGAMEVLGFRFLDKDGDELFGIGKNLEKIYRIDDSECIDEVKYAKFTVMCDVTNPLTGEKGATYVYGAQKCSENMENKKIVLDTLESGMLHYQALLEAYLGKKIHATPGLGAAGGLGAALYAFLGAEMKSGIDVLLDVNGFDEMLETADIVVTGEGKTDAQSYNGKVIHGIAKRCKKRNKPVFVISGSLEGNLEKLYELGVTSMEAAVTELTSIEDVIKYAEENLYQAAMRVFRTLEAGMKLAK